MPCPHRNVSTPHVTMASSMASMMASTIASTVASTMASTMASTVTSTTASIVASTMASTAASTIASTMASRVATASVSLGWVWLCCFHLLVMLHQTQPNQTPNLNPKGWGLGFGKTLNSKSNPHVGLGLEFGANPKLQTPDGVWRLGGGRGVSQTPNPTQRGWVWTLGATKPQTEGVWGRGYP